ncbi:MAG: DNA gyrase subunit A [Armatimonadetes bacterium]|nr:DNA gyrase subunit A [Armatimonadota bacterium]
MKRSYMNYAMSVIIARALPDVRDGLKPVQRRILIAMDDLNLTPGSQHRKSAKIAGDTSGNYHPHGEQVIYPTIVRMVQDFNARCPLIEGQGNFGSVDGDPPAAMRYTEVRMSPFAVEMLADIDKNTVDYVPNYDQTRTEPVVLPARLPNLLANGCSGIAVGMATNIPPHNLGELIDATAYQIDHPELMDMPISEAVAKLMQFLPGPDFPTAGMILGTKGIRQAYETGRGQIVMQAKAIIEPIEGGKSAIIITELPYQVNKARLIEQIADLVKQRKVDGISDIQEQSDHTGMRVVIELKRDAYPKKVLNYLLKHTPLRLTFGVITLALVDGQPRVLRLPQVIHNYIQHRIEIITRRTRFDLEKARHRAHIVEGLLVALKFLDEVVRIIRESRTTEIARTALMTRFGLTQIQAEAILNMLLRQLVGLEQQKLEEEYRNLLRLIASLEEILSDERRVRAIIKQELKALKEKLADTRRTRIVPKEAEEIGEEDVIPEEEMIITITRDGYIKRVPIDAYRSQRRGGRGVIAANTKEEDMVRLMFVATTHHYILFFTDKGKIYRMRAYEVPQASRTAMGTAIINLLSVEPGEQITATVPIRDMGEKGFLVMATARGEIKKTALEEFEHIRSNGIKAFDIEDGDELRWATHTSGKNDIIMVTRKGMAIRFTEEDLRNAGRASGGVRGIVLQNGDAVVSMDIARDKSDLLVAAENGLGKRTPLKEYRPQGRGGRGIQTMNITDRTGDVIDAKVVDKEDRVLLLTANGIGLKLRVAEIRSAGRATQGVKLINLDDGDQVTTIERIVRKADSNGVGEEAEADNREA